MGDYPTDMAPSDWAELARETASAGTHREDDEAQEDRLPRVDWQRDLGDPPLFS